VFSGVSRVSVVSPFVPSFHAFDSSVKYGGVTPLKTGYSTPFSAYFSVFE
jgi:hypothetical protein